ncbi:MAG: 50S ribosomal protein L13 [Polyangiaceae bacterium]
MRTFVAKPEVARNERKWWLIDAKDQPLGRVASQVASLLRGKHKPTFTPHVDTGDFVIVINSLEAKMTGRKADDKIYWHHTGHPGGIKGESYSNLLSRKPEAPLTLAVKGMLPKNVLGRQMIKKLKVYPTAQHPHEAQLPKAFPAA